MTLARQIASVLIWRVSLFAAACIAALSVLICLRYALDAAWAFVGLWHVIQQALQGAS
jgi:hypothetical protein